MKTEDEYIQDAKAKYRRDRTEKQVEDLVHDYFGDMPVRDRKSVG